MDIISHCELTLKWDNCYNFDIHVLHVSGSLDVHVPQIFHTECSYRSRYLYQNCLHDVANIIEQFIWTDYWSIVKLVLNINH